MPSLIPKTLAAKLMAVTAGTIAAVLLASNVVLISQTQERVTTLVSDQAGSEAKAIAAEIAASVGELASAARTMTGVIGRAHQDGKIDREGAITMLKANLEQHAFAFGSWFAEAPQAFDGKVIKDDPAKGGNKDGAFTPYWSKNKAGEAQFSTFAANYAAEWYDAAAKSGKGAITKPYLAEGTDVPTTMSSIAYPVFSNGKLIGVGGADISLGSLSERVSGMRPFGTGSVMLVSQDMKWLVGPSPDVMMKDVDGAGTDAIKAALASGTTTELAHIAGRDGQDAHRLVMPFQLPGLNARWVLLIDVPTAVISAPVNQQTYMMIAGGVAVLLVVLLALYLTARQLIQRPLASLVRDVAQLSGGNYNEPVGGQPSRMKPAPSPGRSKASATSLPIRIVWKRKRSASAAWPRASASATSGSVQPVPPCSATSSRSLLPAFPNSRRATSPTASPTNSPANTRRSGPISIPRSAASNRRSPRSTPPSPISAPARARSALHPATSRSAPSSRPQAWKRPPPPSTN